MRATDLERCFRKIRSDKVAAAHQTVFLAVKTNKHDRERRPPEAASGGAPEHRGDGATIVVGARTHRNGIVMRANKNKLIELFLRQGQNVGVCTLLSRNPKDSNISQSHWAVARFGLVRQNNDGGQRCAAPIGGVGLHGCFRGEIGFWANQQR